MLPKPIVKTRWNGRTEQVAVGFPVQCRLALPASLSRPSTARRRPFLKATGGIGPRSPSRPSEKHSTGRLLGRLSGIADVCQGRNQGNLGYPSPIASNVWVRSANLLLSRPAIAMIGGELFLLNRRPRPLRNAKQAGRGMRHKPFVKQGLYPKKAKQKPKPLGAERSEMGRKRETENLEIAVK